ncbi:MAG: indole-3-glycerol-phosphate synthase [Nitrosopumilus sp. H8]|nr:MAG: indole-3-glycerol-phosphate synthase [Nitrosopumilus sp. H8]
MLEQFVANSRKAISDGIYEIDSNLNNSGKNLADSIRANTSRTILAEIKFASPSLGQIRDPQDPAHIAGQMVSGGAEALSVLTQPHLFNGSPEYLVAVRKAVDVPILMKDIVIDYIQIDAARRMGADYILLIQSLFDCGLLEGIDEFVRYAHKGGLGVLVEAHTAREFQGALGTDADIVGINNRNLNTLEIDLETTKRILEGRQKDRPVLSESGIAGPEDIRYLGQCGADAFLVGSSIMKSGDIASATRRLAEA